MSPSKKPTRTMMLAGLLLAATALSGCASSDKTFVASADKFVNTTVGPEYERYVAADPALSAPQKLDRTQNVSSFRAVVAQKLTGP